MKTIEKKEKTPLQAIQITAPKRIGATLASGQKTAFADKLKAGKTVNITSAYDLKGATVELPPGCILKFGDAGGLKNGTVIGNQSSVIADRKVFDNVSLQGTWTCVGNATWWTDGCGSNGYRQPDNTDDYAGLQQALDSSFRELLFPPRTYYTSQTLVLAKEKKLTLQGPAMANPLAMCLDTRLNTAVIYTDRDIDLLVINVTENGSSPSTVEIQGGNFDASLCRNSDRTQFVPYTSSCIKVLADDNDARLWGLIINTSIFGPGSTSDGTGINLNPVMATPVPGKGYYSMADYGYMTQIRIGGAIHNMGTGVKATSHEPYNWCSGLLLDCAILFCRKAVIIKDVDADIRGLIQADHIEAPDNENALIDIDNKYVTAVCADIFDIGNLTDTARYAVNIINHGATVQAYGHFAALCKSVNVASCTGYTNRFYL